MCKKIDILTMLTVTSVIAIVAGCGAAPTPEAEEAPSQKGTHNLMYPVTKVEEVEEILHNTQVVDSYRWLEDDDAEDVRSWQGEQTTLARHFLDSIPNRAEVLERTAQVFRVDHDGVPVHWGKYYFQMKQKADEDQPVLLVSQGGLDKKRVLIDTNNLSDDNTLTLDWWFPSWDGELVAYGMSLSGSERSTLYVIDTATGEKLEAQIPNTRHCSVAWLPDKSGFYYTRRPDPKSSEKYFNRVYFHKLGTPWREDPAVFGEGSLDEAIHLVQTSPDGRRLVVTVFKGSAGSEVDLYYKLRDAGNTKWQKVAVGKDAAFFPDVKNDKLVVLTNYQAPRYRVIEIDYGALQENRWREIIPMGEDTIDQVLVIKGHLVLKVMHHATSRVFLHDASGKRLKEIQLPTLGTVNAMKGRFDDDEFFYGFTSFFYAGDVYRYILEKADPERVSRVHVPVDPERYVVEQLFYSSKDGTRVPMFVARLKDLDTRRANPVLLTAYGGFNVGITPYFFGKFLPFIEAGGLAALPNLRGGSEYGEEWHRAGMLEKKQNVFDDFISAAEYLIEKGMTTPDKLAIRGGSNGGLLVGAAMTQRPELFKAVICAVPLLDMLRYHKFLLARLWIPEYGSADDPGQFKYLIAYSPYHNVKEGIAYPATLFLTAESDSRVAPFHARKMAALLQSRTVGDEPILLHVETKAGHGRGKPVSKKIEEATDIMAFVMERVGLLKPARWPPTN